MILNDKATKVLIAFLCSVYEYCERVYMCFSPNKSLVVRSIDPEGLCVSTVHVDSSDFLVKPKRYDWSIHTYVEPMKKLRGRYISLDVEKNVYSVRKAASDEGKSISMEQLEDLEFQNLDKSDLSHQFVLKSESMKSIGLDICTYGDSSRWSFDANSDALVTTEGYHTRIDYTIPTCINRKRKRKDSVVINNKHLKTMSHLEKMGNVAVNILSDELLLRTKEGNTQVSVTLKNIIQ